MVPPHDSPTPSSHISENESVGEAAADTETLNLHLRGIDGGPVIPLDIDLRNITQAQAHAYLAEAGELFSNYFPEGAIPADHVLRDNERAGPEGASKVLVACGVPPGVWESRFADIDKKDFVLTWGRAIPRLEMDFDSNSLYVYNA